LFELRPASEQPGVSFFTVARINGVKH
jgi:hypothetical protein